jgi:hypothetical protein
VAAHEIYGPWAPARGGDRNLHIEFHLKKIELRKAMYKVIIITILNV